MCLVVPNISYSWNVACAEILHGFWQNDVKGGRNTFVPKILLSCHFDETVSADGLNGLFARQRSITDRYSCAVQIIIIKFAARFMG